jgi:hypothetical protein
VLHRKLIEMKMAKLDLAGPQVSVYSGVGINKLNLFLNGTRDLGAADLECLQGLLSDLEVISLIFDPAPINFKKLDAIKPLLKQYRDAEFDELLIRKALRLSPGIASDGESAPLLKARYESDSEFRNQIQAIVREHIQRRESVAQF